MAKIAKKKSSPQYYSVLEEEFRTGGEIVRYNARDHIETFADAVKTMWEAAQEMIWDLTGSIMNDGQAHYLTPENEELFCRSSGNEEVEVVLRDDSGLHTLSTFSILAWG